MTSIALYAAWICKYLVYLWCALYVFIIGHGLKRLSPVGTLPYQALQGLVVLAGIGGVAVGTHFCITPLHALPLMSCMATALTYACSKCIWRNMPMPAPSWLHASVFFVAGWAGITINALDDMLWYNIDELIHQQGSRIQAIIADKEITPFCITYHTKLTACATAQKTVYLPGTYRAMVHMPKTVQLTVGDQITILVPPNKNKSGNEPHLGQNSWQTYARKQHIITTLRLPQETFLLASNSPMYSVARFFWQLRKRVSVGLGKQLDRNTLTTMRTIFLGDTHATKNRFSAIRQQYAYWGLSHYLARSGLHLVLLIMLWTLLLALLPLHIRIKKTIRLLLCALFWATTWSSTSFTRTLLMIYAVEIGNHWNAPTQALGLLCHVAWFLLCASPWIVFGVDFQLTFALSAALCIFCTQSAK